MRSSTILLTLGAALAVASPVHRALHKRQDIVSVWDIVTDIVYVTVTEDPNAPAEPTTTVVVYNTAFVQPVAAATTSSTPPPPPPPPPTTSSTPPPAPTTTVPPPPPPAPTTSTEAAPVAVPSPAPVEEPTTTAAAVVASPTDFISTALYHHNVHRANHSSPAVTWDDTLAGYAAITAQTCVFAHDMTEGLGGYGQNLAAYGTSASDIGSLDTSSLVADAITNQWYYGEAAAMIYGEESPPTTGGEYLHFSQVIWKASTTVGCATVQCGAGTIFSYGSWYTVCNYGPEGNVEGSFIENCAEPIGNPPIPAPVIT